MRTFLTSLITVGGVVGAVGTAVVTPGCGDSCEDDATCAPASGGSSASGGNAGAGGVSGGGTGGVAGSGGQGGTGGSAGDGSMCDPTKSPSEEACLVSDEHAIFVSPTGKDGAAGTKADPLKTLTEAATVAAGNKVVVVCNGNYDEHVKVSAGAKIYGGFDCTTWGYQTGTLPNVAPTTAGFALEIDAVSAAVVVEDVAFASKDGAAAGESSITAFIKTSTNVTLSRIKLTAGKGMKGADGVLVPFSFKPQSDLDGNPANITEGGKPKSCACPAGDQTVGGAGGSAPNQGGGGGLPDLGGGGGGVVGPCNPNGFGKDGSPANEAPSGGGASTVGALTSSGWTPTSGANGTSGGAGQGGGGGAGVTGGGGGGGCGGCGGAAGPAGDGGGASIALMSFDSTVTLTDSALLTANAGAGGSGASGQAGQTSAGFGGPSAAGGCQGGAGAAGGSGGAGGGGAGGISVAVLYKGAKPVVNGGSLATGTAGAKGVGGKLGSNDGADGIAQNELETQ
jgi:hypothetical protein